MEDLFVKEITINGKIPGKDYINDLPVIKWLKHNPLTFSKAVTFIVGENGTGKSTLIEGIAVALGFNPEGGSKNFNFSTQKSHSDLHEFLRIRKGHKLPRDGYFFACRKFLQCRNRH